MMRAFDTSRLYWTWHAERYDRATLLLNRRFRRMVARVAEAARGADVLEVAAGTGLVTEALAGTAGRLVATDRSAEMLAVLRARLGASAGRVEVREADATALDFPDGVFGAVVMANLLHLLPAPEKALHEARRVLKPGGLLCAPTFCHGENALARGVSRLLSATGFPIVSRFTAAELRDLVARNGFCAGDCEVFPGLLPIGLVIGRRAEPVEPPLGS